MARTSFDKPDLSPPPTAWVRKAKERAERLAKIDGDSSALAIQREAKRKADALAALYAASRSGVKPEPIPKTPQTTILRTNPITPVSPMSMLSDTELSAKAAAPDRLPDDPTSLDYLIRAEAGDARAEIFRRALSPATGVRA